MTWVRVGISCPQECLDGLKDLLESFDATSISFAPHSREQLFDDLSGKQKYWETTRLTALLDPEIDLDILLACVRNRIGTENITDYQIDLLKDEDWEESYKAGFKPVVIKETLCVHPGWCEAPPGIQCSIQLDPGLAFGTGTHETTALCLEWLVENPVQGKRVIDYGCGSGILGISAAILGAEEVICIDLDPQALVATRDNAEKNGILEKLILISDGKPKPDYADILVANILLEPLVLLSPGFNSYLIENGEIVISGLLANQVDACLESYSEWFEMSAPVFKNEWAMLTGVKRPN